MKPRRRQRATMSSIFFGAAGVGDGVVTSDMVVWTRRVPWGNAGYRLGTGLRARGFPSVSRRYGLRAIIVKISMRAAG